MRIPELIIRSATEQDRQSLANLIHFEVYVHRHLDWRPPIDWVGKNPCLIYERNNHLLAALICPPDPPEAAWIRLFAVSQDMPLEEGWELLWSKALDQLNKMSCPLIAAIALRPWFQVLLEQSGFVQTQDIVSLIWELSKSTHISVKPDVRIRTMQDSDMTDVHALDVSAFGLLWRISLDTLLNAYQQACVATVVEADDRIIGYQISTAGPMGGHLARLAVHPAYQRKGIGTALVNDVLNQFTQRGAVRVTVNTQRDNLTSLSLYEKTGFKPTGEVYPVYQYNWMM
jgi:ribosomal protein S18 acetylase RimI-like enzyme